MCSILAILDIHDDHEALRALALKLSKRLRHRGPDWTGIYADERAILAHERLAIVDVINGAQPLRNADETRLLAVNGEIYNHVQLEAGLATPYAFQTKSDCEVIIPLFEQRGCDFLNDLSGIFAFVIWDAEHDDYLIARDPIGVIPLYVGVDEHGNRFVASEMKALIGVCKTIEEFPAGHYQRSADPAPLKYYLPSWRPFDTVKSQPLVPATLRKALEDAVERQLMCDVPYGTLLSGGLDSSLIAAIAAKLSHRRVEDKGESEAWFPRLHSFSVGLKGSPDLAAAQKVADHIGTVHHSYEFTVQEGIDYLDEVIYHLETFDVTTIRASTPMMLMARKIRAMGIKMVLSGEGSDEIFGGYLYFHKAPNSRELHEETVRKLDALHAYDCLRANKSMAAWGIEARVPFLDREFLDVAMSFDPQEKMCGAGRMEKFALRDAFKGLIPDEILWRQKEQFSDGVGYSWIDSLKAHAENRVSDTQLEKASYRFPLSTPQTKEAYLYRAIFESHYPGDAAAACVPGGPSIACSTAKAIEWDASFSKMADPSGRAIRAVHKDSY
ncbi:MAG: asparagine synthase B [Deltaproteobacteria bacterium CG2_30_63_29]|nr:MAG: asparagine synthase B [Deltaproteobacteria bacterium CG2_30_63_29]PIV98241.1 MAG: asparagine synthase B [Deltaproteobacteria bacterium CG17_big_fil_post_rev_8_21_14_2_50_63_7]